MAAQRGAGEEGPTRREPSRSRGPCRAWALRAQEATELGQRPRAAGRCCPLVGPRPQQDPPSAFPPYDRPWGFTDAHSPRRSGPPARASNAAAMDADLPDLLQGALLFRTAGAGEGAGPRPLTHRGGAGTEAWPRPSLVGEGPEMRLRPRDEAPES